MSNTGKGTVKERTIERIKAGQLVTRLLAFALAKPTDENYVKKLMTTQQVAAARVLLAKVLPDQKAIEQTIIDERKKTVAEINAGLVANGLDPEVIWQSIRKH